MKKNLISIVILLFGIVLIFAAFLKSNPASTFTITAQEMLANLQSAEHVTNMDVSDMQEDAENYVFVDLRSPYDFEVQHIENAVNIPTAFLLDEENLATLNEYAEAGKTVVLYGQIERDAVSPWIMLYQMGFTNTKLLYGGYKCLTENKDDCPTSYPRYDYAKIAKQGGVKEIEVIKKKPAPKKKKTIPVKKKVKVEEEGGC